MKAKDFLSITDLVPDEVEQVIKRAKHIKENETPRLLEGKVLALIFEKPSLRTRVSFEVGIKQMGGECIYLSHSDIGLGIREPVIDVARVLDRLVDGVVARVFSHESLQTLSENTNIPIINALSDLAHPCQALGDLLTINEVKGGLRGLNVTYVGDGNNIASSLALACGSVGTNFTISAPRDYHVPSSAWEEARRRAIKKESSLNWVEKPEEAVVGADVVYTDVWISMGNEAESEERRRVFAQYQVDEQLMARANSDAVFMHDMPAHRGEEVSNDMLDQPNSIVFQQAENRLHAQKAVIAELFAR